MAGPKGDVVDVSDILKGWGDDDEAPRTSASKSAAGGLNTSSTTGGGGGFGRGRLGSGATGGRPLGGGRGVHGGSGEISTRASWRNSARSSAGWSSTGGPQGAGGVGKPSIVLALERAMSRSTFGGAGGRGGGGDGATPEPPREKKLCEELFGTLMGQDGRMSGRGGQGGSEYWAGRDGGGGGGKGEDGKCEVDLGFLHR